MPLYSDYPHDKPTLTSYNQLEDEKKILDFWAKYEAKPRTAEGYYCECREGSISFAWGPPFPTGTPHSGHILNAVLKDVFLRYGHQKYAEVKSKFRWDCHGLPVEHEVDKKLGVKCADDIHKMGVAAYNTECRKFVQRHEAEWKNVFRRIGIRVNFDDTYSALSVQSMERVWSAIKRLFEKGLVYRDTKVLPYSTGCFTHLSDFEAEQKHADVTELGAIVALDIVDSTDKLLVWVVGPWKLVGSAAICLNKGARYVKVKVFSSGCTYIVSERRLSSTFPNQSEYKPLVEFEGTMLKDFICLLPSGFYKESRERRLRILTDEIIRVDVGTGIVALLPHFGADDFRICQENGIEAVVDLCPVDDSGRFKEHIPEVGGLSVFEASPVIIQTFQRWGRFFYVENMQRKRRHCWRSDTPLIEKLVSTWFVRTKDLSEEILENSAKVNWVGHDSHGLLKDAVEKCNDWAVGRSRFWGTPVPIWSSPTGDEVVCVGSIRELLELTGSSSISDLHREFVDDFEIKSQVTGNPPLRRVPDVFDCWFEASLCAANEHQADGIIEGSDQYYGWFYGTMALSAAISQPPPAKNVLVHGLVETPKGEKISKRLHNHSDPFRLVEKYGADAFRLYLLTTPLIGGNNFTLQEKDIPEMASRIFPPLYNILKDILPRFGKSGWISYGTYRVMNPTGNILDRWVLSATERLVQFYDTGLAAFRPQELVAKIADHMDIVDDLYVPIRRRKFKEKDDDMVTAVLYDILLKVTIILSPFAPFLTEHILQIIKPWVSYYWRDLMYKVPLMEVANGLIVEDVEEKVDSWRTVINLVRDLRKEYLIPIHYRISELILISSTGLSFKDEEFLNETLPDFINVHHILMTTERAKFGVELKADIREDSFLSQKLCPADVGEIASIIQAMNDREVEELIQNKSLTVNDKEIPLGDIRISCKVNRDLDKNEAITSQGEVVVIIRMKRDMEYYREGTRQELVNSVLKFRKKCKVYSSEEATVCYASKDECMRHAFERYADHLRECTKSVVRPLDYDARSMEGAIQMKIQIMGAPVELCLYKEAL